MANNIRLECYSLRIRSLRSEKYFSLDKIKNSNDLFNILLDYINTHDKELLINEDYKKTIQFNSILLL